MENMLIVVGDFRKELAIKEYRGFRVVTFRDIDELHGSAEGSARKNFNYNKKRFVEGDDYFVVNYDESKRLFGIHAPLGLIVLTESGYLMISKSLQDDLAWQVQRFLVKSYFKAKELSHSVSDTSSLSPLLQVLINLETRQNKLEAKVNEIDEVRSAVNNIADSITKTPDSTVVTRTVNEIARWTRLDQETIYNKAYEIFKDKHGIDIPRRVANERQRIQDERTEKNIKPYAESTLKGKLNGLHIMVREGCLDQFHEILVAWLEKEKSKSKLRLVR